MLWTYLLSYFLNYYVKPFQAFVCSTYPSDQRGYCCLCGVRYFDVILSFKIFPVLYYNETSSIFKTALSSSSTSNILSIGSHPFSTTCSNVSPFEIASLNPRALSVTSSMLAIHSSAHFALRAGPIPIWILRQGRTSSAGPRSGSLSSKLALSYE